MNIGHVWDIIECINWNFMAHVACVTKIRNTYTQKVVLISCKSHIVHVIDVGFIGMNIGYVWDVTECINWNYKTIMRV